MIKVLAVIVLHNKIPQESVTFQTLQLAKDRLQQDAIRLKVLFYDNTPRGSDPGFLPEYALYKSDPKNGGLACAYNYALKIAEAEGFPWLLTLDHDTSLPDDVLTHLCYHVQALEANPRIAVIVPQLVEHGVLLSPRYVAFGHTRSLPAGFVGIPRREIHAFNSVSLWRIAALREIDGFCEYFWLDYLDIWAHHQLHRAGLRCFVAGNIQVEHELSLLDYKNRLTAPRFQNFLQAESAFLDLHKGSLENLAHALRLICRLFKQKIRRDDPAIQKVTYECLKQRLTESKVRRIAKWKMAMQGRPGLSSSMEQQHPS